MVVNGALDKATADTNNMGESLVQIHLKFPLFSDSFTWDISNPDNQPETFASELVRDLALEPAVDYSVAIAYEIRKQIQIFVCQKVQGFCNIWDNYVSQRVDEIGPVHGIPREYENKIDQTLQRFDDQYSQDSRAAEESDVFMKEDLFSSSSARCVSVADEKQLSILNSQLDGYKTTNAPDSNDKQNVEPAPSNQSNCERIPPH
jgi:hypothetical protein